MENNDHIQFLPTFISVIINMINIIIMSYQIKQCREFCPMTRAAWKHHLYEGEYDDAMMEMMMNMVMMAMMPMMPMKMRIFSLIKDGLYTNFRGSDDL